MSIFDKYASAVNADELAQSQREIEENANTGNYSEVPSGKYEVKVDKLEVSTAPWGEDQIAIQFRILKGDYANQCIFYNQGFAEDWKRHRAVKMLAQLADDPASEPMINLLLKGDIDTVNDFCMDLHEEIDGKLEYLLEYSSKPAKTKDGKAYTKKDYSIADVYDAE